jgi:hypothetical protein
MADTPEVKDPKDDKELVLPGINDGYLRFSKHNPSIPTKYMTFFCQKNKMLGFGTASKRKLSSKPENNGSYNNQSMLVENPEVPPPYCGHRRQASLPEKPAFIPRKEPKYFRYIFVGRAAQERAIINKNGVIFPEKTERPLRTKKMISTQSQFRYRLKKFKEINEKMSPEDQHEEAGEEEKSIDFSESTVIENKQNDQNENKPKKRKNTRFIVHHASNPQMTISTDLQQAISAKRLLAEEGHNPRVSFKESKENVSSQVPLPKIIRDFSDVNRLVKELRKHSIVKDSEPANCLREQKLYETYKAKKPMTIVKNEYVPKEATDARLASQMPGLGTYNISSNLLYRNSNISKKGYSNFVSKSNKNSQAAKAFTEAIYSPLVQLDKTSFIVNFGNKWV